MNAVSDTVDMIMDGWLTIKEDMTRVEAAEKIGQLAKLGRTERWQEAIKTWQAVVLDTEHPFEHAVTQWAIFTNFAAL